MKRLIAAALAVLMISLGLTACGGDSVDPAAEPKTEEAGTEHPKGEEPKADHPKGDEKKDEHPKSEHPK